MINKISKNLSSLLFFLIQEQINDESAQIIEEIINMNNVGKNISKTKIINNLSLKKEINTINLNLDNIFERLIDLNYIEINSNEEISILVNNILNILFYPRYCYYINCIYGPKYLKIFEYLLEFGFYCLDNCGKKFSRNDFDTLVRDGILIKYSIKNETNKDNDLNIFSANFKEIYKINYILFNGILFKEYIIAFYKNYISMNFNFYELFKKLVNSDNFTYELKNYEKNFLNDKIKDNFEFDKLIIKEDNQISLNKDIIKYDLFYNSMEKIINVIYSSKHIRILKIIRNFENLNIFQISQKACMKCIEVEELLNDLVIKIKIVKKVEKNENHNHEEASSFCLNEISEEYINAVRENIYDIIKNIKFELKDKLKELQGRISKETQIQYINKYYSLINSFSEILNSYNFLFVN